MKHIVGGAEGNSIMALVHWFLDDNAAFCNGIRLLATCLGHLSHLGHLGHLAHLAHLIDFIGSPLMKLSSLSPMFAVHRFILRASKAT